MLAVQIGLGVSPLGIEVRIGRPVRRTVRRWVRRRLGCRRGGMLLEGLAPSGQRRPQPLAHGARRWLEAGADIAPAVVSVEEAAGQRRRPARETWQSRFVRGRHYAIGFAVFAAHDGHPKGAAWAIGAMIGILGLTIYFFLGPKISTILDMVQHAATSK